MNKFFKYMGIFAFIMIIGTCLNACAQNDESTKMPGTASETVSATAASENVITIKLAHMNSTSDAVHKAAEKIKAGVEKRTGNQVMIELYPSGQLGENKEVLEQALLGSNLMGQCSVGLLEEYVPNYSIFLHPFLFNSWEEAQKVINSDLVKGWEDDLKDNHNIVVLGYGNFGVRDFYTVNTPVRTPEDMRGLLIRVQPIQMYTEMITALGASPQTLPWMEVYSALTQKVVDGAEAPPSSIVDQKHYEVVKYLSVTEHMLDVTTFCTSRQLFESLTKEQQQILLEETASALEWMSQEVMANNDKLLDEIEATGVEVIRDVDKPAFQEATKNISEAFPEWSDGLYEEVLSIINK